MSKCWASPPRQCEKSSASKNEVGLQVRQGSPEDRALGQILKIGSNYQDEEWEEGLCRQNEKQMQITLLKSGHDAFPSKPCTFSDVSRAPLLGSSARARVRSHLDSPSRTMAPWGALSPCQKARVPLDSPLFFTTLKESANLFYSIC